MSDPSVLLHAVFGGTFFIIACLSFLAGAIERNPLIFAVGLGCLGSSLLAPFQYNNALETKHWVDSVGTETPKRKMSISEVRWFGQDATKGTVYGEANSDMRLYCVDFFDETAAAFIPRRKGWHKLESTAPCKFETALH